MMVSRVVKMRPQEAHYLEFHPGLGHAFYPQQTLLSDQICYILWHILYVFFQHHCKLILKNSLGRIGIKVLNFVFVFVHYLRNSF